MRIWFILLLVQVLALACKGGDSRSATGTPTTGSTTNPDDPDNPADPGGAGVAESLEFGTLATSELYTSETAAGSCLDISVTASAAAGVVADVGIILTVETSSTMEEKGKVTVNSGVTDTSGVFSTSYCAGKSEGVVTIVAKAGAISTNSGKITVAKKPLYEFVYSRADVDPTLIPGDGPTDSQDKVLYLNTFDSGPQDCTTIYFKLNKSGTPIVGEEVTFKTQLDYPKGAKLAKRLDAVTTETDSKTGKKFAVYTSTSSGAGEFAVPVCAGVSLGTMLISGTWHDEDEDKNYSAKSPVIRITSGITNYINMSLTFDPNNGRTLKAYYNTNSNYELPFEVQLGARFDGRAIIDFPVSIATEVGRYRLENGGIADAVKGTVKASLLALHLVDNYPYAVKTFPNFPLAQTRCEPSQIAAYAQGQGLTEYTYADLAKNWRSTMVYSIRGQEHFHDANRNGIYDEGGDGFWDKNQNGFFDTGDVLTFDAGGDGVFNPAGEWFIDLPTPFVDVNEDGVYTATVDQLIGDEYSEPNGKRDSDTLLWKYEYFPVSMGPSIYGMQRPRIQAADYTLVDPTMTVGGDVYNVFGVDGALTAADIWGGAVDDDAGVYPWGIFAHDLCGNLLAGGTKVNIFFETIHAPEWGGREPTGHIPVQPGDVFLEPSRQLVRGTDDGAVGIINFNAIDHPSKSQSYPLVGFIDIPACNNVCTGDTVFANPGVSCDGYSGYAVLKVTEPSLDQAPSAGYTTRVSLNYGNYGPCNCATGAVESRGVCTCSDSSKSSDGTACN